MVAKRPPTPSLIPTVLAADLDEPIAEIVRRNTQSGRFQRVCRFLGRTLTLEEYGDIVAAHYTRYHDLVSHLICGDQEAWDRLCCRLFRGAYTLLMQRGWSAEQAYTRAQEAVQDTCLSIYCRTFTYDCPFDAWAFAILRHHVFRSHHRPRNPLDSPGVIDSEEDIDESDLGYTADLTNAEQHELLVQALSQLRSTAQKQVVECLYFEGQSSEETAQKLGKTVQSVYNLKGRALANLRALLAAADAE